MSVYKPCDIRGHVAELSRDLYRRWGVALGRWTGAGARVVVGGDVRASTPEFMAGLIDGLCSQGTHVFDLGIVPTPMVYFAKRESRAAACAIVTASHNPPHINGLKFMIGDRPPTEADILRLERDAETKETCASDDVAGRYKRRDVAESYGRWLESAFAGQAGPVGAPVIVDPGNGCWAGRAAGYLRRVFPETQFAVIFDEPDGMFPNRDADCSKPEYLERLAAVVQERGAALGIAFDGDGDRVAFVDNEGTGLTAEEATYVLLHSFAKELPGRVFVYDLKFSDRMREAASRLGGVPTAERSGHAFIRTRMLDTGAVFGAEVSGHYFHAALGGGDDGLYTACRMLAHVAAQGRPLADLRRECPAIYMTPDLRVRVASEERAGLIDDVKAAFAEYPQSFIDGVRIDFPEGWALLRASVTEPAVTLRFEATSAAALDALVRQFCARIPQVAAACVPPVTERIRH